MMGKNFSQTVLGPPFFQVQLLVNSRLERRPFHGPCKMTSIVDLARHRHLCPPSWSAILYYLALHPGFGVTSKVPVISCSVLKTPQLSNPARFSVSR